MMDRPVSVVVAALAAMFATPAVAQSGPAADCAKASNEIELAICATPELATADREMAAAYGALNIKLTGAAKDHLLKDQQQWLTIRNEACVGSRVDVIRCIKRHDEARFNNLRAMGEGLYPFVSERALIKTGRVGKISYAIDATWPRFDGTTADFSALNRDYAETTTKAANEVIPPDTSAGDLRGEQLWPYLQWFNLQRPSANAVAVAIISYAFAGGAHGYGGTSAQLVDLRTGRKATLGEVFGSGDAWLQTLVPLVRDDLKKQFANDRPGFDDAIAPANLAKQLRDPSIYYFQAERLQLIFNPYAVGPYSSGTFLVNIPYTTLKPLFAAAGPMGEKR
jgi:uncharacterized protein YecT (DUF1311 family)